MVHGVGKEILKMNEELVGRACVCCCYGAFCDCLVVNQSDQIRKQWKKSSKFSKQSKAMILGGRVDARNTGMTGILCIVSAGADRVKSPRFAVVLFCLFVIGACGCFALLCLLSALNAYARILALCLVLLL